MPTRSLAAVLLIAIAGIAATFWHRVTTFQSSGARVRIEEYASRAAKRGGGAVVLLHGSGGLQSTAFPYTQQARLFADTGCRVYLPHYLDVTHGSAREPELHYGVWAETVRDALRNIQSRDGVPARRTVIAGYSLGASVALGVAALEPRLAGIVV